MGPVGGRENWVRARWNSFPVIFFSRRLGRMAGKRSSPLLTHLYRRRSPLIERYPCPREKRAEPMYAHITRPHLSKKAGGPLFHLVQGDVPGGEEKEARKRSRPSLFKAGRGDRGLAMLLAAKWSDACFQRGREKGCTCIQYVRAMVYPGCGGCDLPSRHLRSRHFPSLPIPIGTQCADETEGLSAGGGGAFRK